MRAWGLVRRRAPTGGSGLGDGDGEEVGGECLDLPLDRCGVELGVGVGEDRFVLVADRVVALGAAVWGGRGVVLFDHFRAVADLGDQLLLRVEVVRHLRLQSPDLVE